MKRYHVTLTESERNQLKAIIAKRKAHSQVVKRAYLLLAADQNQPAPLGHIRWAVRQLAQQRVKLNYA